MTKEAICDVYQKALKQLSTIYDKREADLILHYLFEDMWQIRHLQGNQSTFDKAHYVVFEQCFDQLMKQVPWQYVVGQADFLWTQI